MRLNDQEKSIIRQAAISHFGEDSRILLFGSRADNEKKGGDIDLLIIPSTNMEPREIFQNKIAMLVDLELNLGIRNIDLLVEYAGDYRGIVKSAKMTGKVI